MNLVGDPPLLAHAKQYKKKKIPVPVVTAQTLRRHFQAKAIFYAHISPHLTYASTVWDGCSDILFHKLNSLYRRAAKLMMPDLSLTTDAKLQHLGLLPLREKLMLNKSCASLQRFSKSGIPVSQKPFYLPQQSCPIAIYDTTQTQNRPV